ncbi:DNA (cytosine-5)-methyltransferase DRM2-like [Telopea speciosissima]|uniref:DNA (cytosine-5)-methyltransferase DRM2-like n=1 Tax=Telopea speciosissima TaxID=54955 RepID=UPI001CC7B6C4|nr:DNA (cytosine-5)-methyltransferase DRM2-like [Telopea speciosissima]XP_043725116.1 DNA (cytosine-5)-methyltransferase DRM2-like [Telopea speciosissima]XP_043725117.1 DNA (cytosine-5)-methyltransferase DRM2-like [Telopea speciosissima]XP_043725118.1 DNA (cytosine-5)-methyltransferase DRM2-like [Telopea speciosissima]XP_043725120.1 DNA (cytosine-5)-methyltransferase DRM2-like [Telopea speciosissima]
MDENTPSGESDEFDWDSNDENEIQKSPLSSCLNSSITGREEGTVPGKANSSAANGPSNFKLIRHFVGMGFSENLVAKAIKENGEDNTETILEALLTYVALEKSPPKDLSVISDINSSDSDGDSNIRSIESEGDFLDELSDWSGDEENMDHLSDKEKKLLLLVDMGYYIEEASAAIDRCGPDSSIMELTDFISAAQMAREADAQMGERPRLPPDDQPGPSHSQIDPRNKKRQLFNDERWERKRQRGCEKKVLDDDEDTVRLPNPMLGFGVPGEPALMIHRTLPEAAIGSPYFYYENVALAPKGVWRTISRFLYDIEPEFVDSQHLCATARKRGYVHNLPIHNRHPILPLQPRTIHEALPLTRKWWPAWDRRTKLNCLQTCTASAKLTERIRRALEGCEGVPSLKVQKEILDECRKWNLVWVGRNKVAPLEPDEIEMLLGFPKNHTRGGGISRTERLKALGNSFQVDTVAYHLSVLKDIFPGGINLLSLFSGIGGAEVALHRLGIPLKNVVSVEISETSRNILKSWWEQTNQTGKLIDFPDVQQLNGDRLEQLISSFGGFDLIVGGSPCNNLSGSNRVSRDGLEGKHSSLFYDYFRILDLVKCIMGKD